MVLLFVGPGVTNDCYVLLSMEDPFTMSQYTVKNQMVLSQHHLKLAMELWTGFLQQSVFVWIGTSACSTLVRPCLLYSPPFTC